MPTVSCSALERAMKFCAKSNCRRYVHRSHSRDEGKATPFYSPAAATAGRIIEIFSKPLVFVVRQCFRWIPLTLLSVTRPRRRTNTRHPRDVAASHAIASVSPRPYRELRMYVPITNTRRRFSTSLLNTPIVHTN